MITLTSPIAAAVFRLIVKAAFLILLLLPVQSQAQTAWVQSQRSGNEVRFLFTGSIQRYDVSTKAWLGAVTLPRSGATAFTGDAAGNYVAYGTSIYRYTTAWTGEAASGTASSSVHGLFLDGNLLLAVHSTGLYARLTSFNRATGAQLSTKEVYVDSLYGAAHAPGLNKLFGRTSGISPADIVMAGYTDAGAFSGPGDSPYHGGYPDATKTFVSPDEGRVIDTSGTIYTTDNLTYLGALGGQVTDIEWNASAPIVLRHNLLIAYRNTYQEAARYTLSAGGAELALHGGEAFVFAAGTTRPSVQTVPLSAIPAPDPGDAINPSGMEYDVDGAFADRDGVVYLYNKALMSLFRWSPADRAYRSTISLNGSPSYLAYSKENHAAYTAYSSLALRRINLTAAAPEEVNFVTLPETGIGLITGGGLIYSVKSGGYGVYGASGNLIGNATNTSYMGREVAYDPVRRRLYHFRDGISPNDLHYDSIGTNGLITGSAESPYHGDYSFYAPIRVSPDGNQVLTGSGAVFNASDLRFAASLANPVTDALWKGTTLVSLRLINGLTQLQTWTGAAFTPGAVRQFGGTPVRLFDTPQGLLVVSSVAGTPRFTLLDSNFDTVYTSPTRPNTPSGLTVTGRTVDSVSFRWTDLSDNEDGFRLEYRRAGSTGAWTAAPDTAAGATTGSVTGLTLATAYEFRVSAVTADLVSPPAGSVSATTLSSPDQPAGEPYNFEAIRIYHNSITLAWTDNAANETGFRILRSTTPAGTTTPVDTAPNATSYTDSGVAANTTYYYRIRSMNGAIEGDLSAQITVKTLAAASAPAAPSTLTASEITGSSVRLTWKDNSTNEDQFIIERSASPVTVWTEAGRAGYNGTTFVNTGLQANTTYSFRVRSANTTGSSSSSNITATTLKLGGEYRSVAVRQGNIYYLAFSGPDRLERYDLAKREWMTPLALQGTVTGLWADAGGIYVAEGRAISRWNPDGTGRTALANAQSDVTSMFTIGNVFAFQGGGSFSGNWTTVNKLTGTVLDSFEASYSVAGLSVDPTLNRAFMRSTGVSPSDIRYLDIGSNGKLIRSGDSPYHGTYPDASRTFVFPKGGRVADDSGTVYLSDGLAFSNTLGAAFKDLTFRGDDVPVVLRGNKLHAYRNNFLEAGSFTLSSSSGQRVAVDGSDALVFITDGNDPRGMRVQTVPLASFNTPEPNQPLDPSDLAYTVDDAFVDRDGILNLYSRGNLSFFRWSTLERSYKPTLALSGGASYIAYAPGTHTAFLAYSSQVIRKLDLRNPAPAETLFATMASRPGGIAAAGEYIYAVKEGGYVTYSPGGTVLTDSDFTYYTSATNTWDPVRRRVYHFREGVSPDDLHYETLDAAGRVSGSGETPYHGDFEPRAPIRVSPDGAKVAIGSGVIFNASGMTKAATLSVTLTDMAWLGGLMTSIEAQGSTSTKVQRWSSAWARDKSVTLGGTPLRCFTLASGSLLVVTKHSSGVPRFHILDSTLAPVYDSIPTPPAILEQPQGTRVDFGTSATLRVTATGSPTLRYQWSKGGTAIPDATTDTLTIPSAGSLDSGSYTVTVSNNGGSVTSAPAGLGVGPIASPLFGAGRLLVSSAGKVHEYSATNTLVRSLTVPMAPEAASQRTYDVVVDRLGLIHLINQGLLNGSNQYYLSTFDSAFTSWQHRVLPGFTSTSTNADGDAAIRGDWLLTRFMALNLRTGDVRQLPAGFSPIEVTVGRDDDIYGVGNYGELRRLSPTAWTWSSPINLGTPTELHGLGVNEDGILYAGLSAPSVQSYSTSGVQLAVRNLNNPDTAGVVQDVSISPTGQIATGHQRAYIALLNAALTSHSYVAMPVAGVTGTYTTWMPDIVQPSPAFAGASAPAATEDIPWSWTPVVTHPDPDAVLTVSGVELPPWIQLANGVLTGTPLQQHAGNHTVILKVQDGSGRSAQQTFTVAVTAVNDAPVSRDITMERSEDAPQEEILLTELFTDEETPALAYSILSNTGGIVTAELTGPASDRLRLSFVPNANGPAVLSLRAADAGGLSVDATVTVNAAAVNDLPAGSLGAITAAEDAAPVLIDLAAAFADIETPDEQLQFTVSSTSPEIVQASLSGSTLMLVPQRNANGSLQYTVRCTDHEGGFLEITAGITVIPVNDPPEIPAAIPPVAAGDAAQDAMIDFSPFAQDPDSGDTQAWQIVSNSNPELFNLLAFDAQGRLFIRYAPFVSGEAVVTVEISDGAGTTARRSFTVSLPALPPPTLTTQSVLSLNRQTGLWEQHVTVRNDGQRAIGGFEIHISGLPAGACLYNASDCLTGTPAAGYYLPVAVGESVSLVLEYYSPDRTATLLPQLTTLPVLPREESADASGMVHIDRVLMLEPGAFLLEFPAAPGEQFIVQYSTNGTHWIDSFVRIRAGGTRVQWIDRGAPRTTSPPLPGQSRFYRVKKVSGL